MASINKVKWLLRFEGIFYLLTGLWPLLHFRSFLEITGFKTDIWMVVTVGALLALNGLLYLVESRSRVISKAVVASAIAVPVILLWIDLFYVFSGVISSVYIVDAVIENLILICWVVVFVSDTILTSPA